MRTVLRYLPLVAVVVTAGCADLVGEDVIRGSGPVVAEERTTARFYGVSNATAAQVEVIQGPYDRVVVRGQDNIVRYIRTRVENGDLRIYTDPGVRLEPTDLLVVEVDVRTLDWLSNSGSGELLAPVIDAGTLEVVSSGAGPVRVTALLGDTLIVNSSGGGAVYVDGDVLSYRVMVSGAGDVDARDLLARRVDARLSGGGDATLRARDRLDATISGSGSVRYYGSPVITSNVTGTGRLTRVGSY